MKKTLTKSQQGKKNKRDGAKFELLVRKYLESKGWIVSKWMNNVEFPLKRILGGVFPEVPGVLPDDLMQTNG